MSEQFIKIDGKGQFIRRSLVVGFASLLLMGAAIVGLFMLSEGVISAGLFLGVLALGYMLYKYWQKAYLMRNMLFCSYDRSGQRLLFPILLEEEEQEKIPSGHMAWAALDLTGVKSFQFIGKLGVADYGEGQSEYLIFTEAYTKAQRRKLASFFDDC
ncbi:hypothetical protein MO867_11365 [Microbulbifer sp. OS29]|uniref:Uncharacterized protein n=1 Tax=Microbulbifer okhotskensis TaxID=2926617 RepID=A0A9X2EMF0_9GAMM|nr:hypothetical protein [Microbulbifer okhotskensis]MCO1334937.1 hypothetical protein [Microbulbifer okhotskensis]